MDREEQRNKGIFYTPKPVSRFMIRSILGELLKKVSKSQESIKILDPTCGEGVFLSSTLQIFFDSREELENTGDFKFHIFGLDIDEGAIDRASKTLTSLVEGKNERENRVELHLHVKNALTCNWDGYYNGFDLIIGNPPYIPWYNIPYEEREIFETGTFQDITYSCRPSHNDSQPNYYLFFLVLANNLLSDDGIVSFLLPQEWLYHAKACDFRNYLLEHFREIHVLEFDPSIKIFDKPGENVGTNTLILTLFKKGKKEFHHEFIKDLNVKENFEFLRKKRNDNVIHKDFTDLLDREWIFVPQWKLEIQNQIHSQDVIPFTDSNYFEVKGGFQPPITQAKLFEITKEKLVELNDLEKNLVFPLVLQAGEIERYKILDNPESFWIVANEIENEINFKEKCPNLHEILSDRLDTTKKAWWHFPNVRNFSLIQATSEKLLSPRTANRPSFALDVSRSVFKGTNTMIISKVLPAKYVLAILNSSLSSFWYDAFGFDYHGGKTKKYEPSKAKKHLIPIKRASKEVTDELIIKVDDLLTARKSGVEDLVVVIEEEIDELVLRIYNLSGKKFLR
ncbi:MAG: N-6 DNA methylase [Candidatus Hodarchaeota archaeon]